VSKYLIDTHILLWWFFDDKNLKKNIREIITNEENEIKVSIASLWEITIKKSLNKLKAPDNLKEALEESNFQILPITLDHLRKLEHLPNLHNDPFDRLFIAQSIFEKLTFITADKNIKKYKINNL